MMKASIALLLLALGGSAMASDELAQAIKLVEAKSYPQALSLFTKLAAAGNAEAQFRLGEMYWYGEAGAIDLEQARNWFSKSASAGNKEAAAALEVMRQREVRRKDIDYWVGGYDGVDMKSGQFACDSPEFPVVSKNNAEIAKIEKSYAAWRTCYNGFVQNLNDALPPGKRIPADISPLMNQIEYDQSVAHLDKIYGQLSQQSSQSAQATMANYQGWRKATEAFVNARNIETKVESDLNMLQLQQANQAMSGSARGGAKGKPGK